MKRMIVLVLAGCFLIGTLSAQVLDKPAATVKLTKTESITVSQLQKAITALEGQAKRTLTTDERKQVLDALIANILILQAAVRDKVVISDAEMKTVVASFEQQLGNAYQLGRSMTDAELETYAKSGGLTLDALQKQLRDQQTMLAYVRQKRKDMFDAIKPATDQDIQDYYDNNKTNYFMTDMITLKHIFIDTRQLTSKDDRDKAAKHADDVLKELKAGAAFADLVTKYSEDTGSKYNGGVLGTWFRGSTQVRQTFGAAFFDAVFKLKKGEMSGVLQSNLGYHIVLVTERLDARLLGLNDKIPPQNQMTVKDAITNTLMLQQQNDVLKAAEADLVAELRKQAEIKIFDDNIGW
ncbi:MAG: peptidylprolyl isomerase [Spirochaetia bacterium]|jgi:parvulin-like peptidyl-prolyl isomerase